MAGDRWYIGQKLTAAEWKSLKSPEKQDYAAFLFEKFDGNARQAALWIGLNRSTLQAWFQKHRDNPVDPGTDSEVHVITGDRVIGSQQSERIIRANGFDPEDWDVVAASLNEAEDKEGNISNQAWLKIQRKPESLIRPALERTPGWRPPKAKPVKPQAVERIMLLTDQHAPLGEQTLLDASVELARLIQPAKIVKLGDGMDADPWSRHRAKERRDLQYDMQDCIDEEYIHDARLAEAAPDARRVKVIGNHDWWMFQRMLEQYPQLFRLHKACSDERLFEPDDIFIRMLRMDETGWELARTDGGEYFESEHRVLPDLMGLHGVRAGKHGGAVLEFDGWHGTSVAQGHDHTMALIRHVKRLPNGTEVAYWSWSLGAMTIRPHGYSHKRQVHQGFGVVTVFEDGSWVPEVVPYDPQRDVVMYRDWIFYGGR